jgi:hypothetical protein
LIVGALGLLGAVLGVVEVEGLVPGVAGFGMLAQRAMGVPELLEGLGLCVGVT